MNKRNAVISALFEKKNKRKPKNSQELQDFVKSQGGEEFLKKVDEYIAQVEKDQAQQAQKAAHGAKLQYFKNLKHQCADDEEIVYYRNGGNVNCGCKKKEGGEIKKEPKNAVEKFKKAKFGDTLTRIADATGSQGGFKKAKEDAQKLKKKAFEEKWRKGQVIVGKDLDRGVDPNKKSQDEHGMPDKNFNKGIGKNCNGSKIKVSCGGSTLKKHQQGGSLIGTPFIK